MATDRTKRPREAGPPARPSHPETETSRGLPSPRRPTDPAAEGAEHEGRSARRALALAGVAGLAGGAVAGLAVARRLGRDVPPLYRSLRSTPLDFPFRNHRVVWYTAGNEGAIHKQGMERVVLIHGIHAAASAWEMRELFDRLAADHRVYALDLLGFGASDRPEIDYDDQLYVDLLREFLRREVRRPAHVVASSVSAAHAIALAAEDPEPFASLTVINPTGLLTQAEGQRAGGRLVETVVRAPWIGEALYNLLVSRPSLRRWASRLYQGSDLLLEEHATAHHYSTSHQPGARFAPAAFLGDALARNTYVALRGLEVPLLAIWSEDGGPLDTGEEQAAFSGVAPEAEHVWIESGALPHEQAPEEVADLVRGWVARNRPKE